MLDQVPDDGTQPAPEMVPGPHGGLLRVGNPGNSGGKPGRSGRPRRASGDNGSAAPASAMPATVRVQAIRTGFYPAINGRIRKPGEEFDYTPVAGEWALPSWMADVTGEQPTGRVGPSY